MQLSKETSLFDKDSIKDDVQDAGQKADAYISTVTSDGIFVHQTDSGKSGTQPTDPTAYGVHISDNVDIIQGGQSVASYGTTARIGKSNSSRFLINSGSLQAFNSSNSKYFEVTENGMSFGTNTVATTANVSTAKSEAISTAATDATNKANNAISTAATDATNKANNAISTAAADATNKANNAAKTASNYITTVTNNGIFVHQTDSGKSGTQPTDSTAYGVHISDSVNIIRGGNNVASFGPTVTLGSRKSGTVGTSSMAIGTNVLSSGNASYAEGNGSESTGTSSHAEGHGTKANGNYSHAEGNATNAIGHYSHVEGYKCKTTSNGNYSHVEGQESEASGHSAHAEGYKCKSQAAYSHSEGNETVAEAYGSHAEGHLTTAHGTYTHAEGESTLAYGPNSHAEGLETEARGANSHASGVGTKALGNEQTVIGRYNETDTDSLFIIGNGSENSPSNAFYVTETGQVVASGKIIDKSGGACITEQTLVVSEELLTQSLVISEGSQMNDTYVVSKANHYPIGIIGWGATNGSGAGGSFALPYMVYLWSAAVGEAQVRVGIRAVGGKVNGATFRVSILWIKG